LKAVIVVVLTGKLVLLESISGLTARTTFGVEPRVVVLHVLTVAGAVASKVVVLVVRGGASHRS
jgi:hypothetical protein